MNNDSQIHLMIDEESKRKLEKIAFQKGMTLSTYIRSILKNEIETNKKEVK